MIGSAVKENTSESLLTQGGDTRGDISDEQAPKPASEDKLDGFPRNFGNCVDELSVNRNALSRAYCVVAIVYVVGCSSRCAGCGSRCRRRVLDGLNSRITYANLSINHRRRIKA